MNRRNLVDIMSKQTGISKKDSTLALNTLLYTISNALAKKERVTLVGFGTFYTITRKARKARNPRTGAMINIPKRNTARWHASSKLQKRVR